MSLRDQLLAKGLVSKKQARKSDQAARKKRRSEKGAKRKRKVLEAEARAKKVDAATAKAHARQEARRERESERERMERALQIRNTILGHRMAAPGTQRFHHRCRAGEKILRMDLSTAMVERLRRGDAAIVASHTQYVLVTRRGAEKLQELAPGVLVFWQADTKTLSRPDQQPHSRDWEPSLGARRATPEDVRRLRESARLPCQDTS